MDGWQVHKQGNADHNADSHFSCELKEYMTAEQPNHKAENFKLYKTISQAHRNSKNKKTKKNTYIHCIILYDSDALQKTKQKKMLNSYYSIQKEGRNKKKNPSK